MSSQVHALTVEAPFINGRSNPLGISNRQITLSWRMTSPSRGAVQKAYRIRIGDSSGAGNVWDSKRIESDRQVGIPLPGALKLSPASRYWCQVKVWDGAGVESEWSKPAWFETGLNSPSDWVGAAWIVRDDTNNRETWRDYIVRLEFQVHDVAMGVLLRASAEGEDAYMNQINVGGPTPRLVLHRKDDGAYSVLKSVDLAPFGITNESLKTGRHTLEFEVVGPRITTKLDGILIDQNTEATYPTGYVGLRTFGQERGRVYSVKVVDSAGGNVLLETDFADGRNPFRGGTVENGSYVITGNNEAVFSAKPLPLPLLRSTFVARKKVRRARIYASARGVYELTLNGKKVGDQFLAPGWTDYRKRIQSQSYDVAGLIQEGQNVLGAALGHGWYSGKVGLGWKRVYGDAPALIAKVKVTYEDGSVEWFGTDERWKAFDSPRLVADLQDGETYDARLEQAGWNTAAFNGAGGNPVRVMAGGTENLVPQPDEPVRVTEVLKAKSHSQPLPGVQVYDLGQNMVGVARVKMTGKQGQTVKIRYAEELYRLGARKGQLYTDNFRSAKVTDEYTFARDGTVTYQPAFTQHGFRYIEVFGADAPPKLEDVSGVVLGSDLPNTGDLVTSNPMLNQLVRNIRWGQRGNFLSIPTDTPARDERLGWTGDISVFAPTASYLQDTRSFLSKWMDDVRDSQREDGNIPAVVPQPRNAFNETGVGWSDAVITVPYSVWVATGDDTIVRRNWDVMHKFYGFLHRSATGNGTLLEEGRNSWFSGDWLNLEAVDRLQEHKVIGTAYFAENTRMMAEMAAAMGDDAKAREWAALVPQIRQAFTDAYVNADGSVYTNTQTVYAMALGMGLVSDPAKRQKVAGKFVAKLAADNYHLRTGFLGTPWLLPALSSLGRSDLAFRLLLNEDYPSWGFEVKMGATTMWERWNTIRENGEFGPVEMNSFNHYAYGAVGEWMFKHIGGLQALEAGYKKSRIAPVVGGGGLTSAKASLRTAYGPLSCDWRVVEDTLTLKASVPANTTSEIVIPASGPEVVLEGKSRVQAVRGVKRVSFKDGLLTVFVGSGDYVFTARQGK